ncbi:hypothetical protein CYFUS_007168 [Cystobacter fuscus]|uniref:Lipoprotein n=1 Tax=Cystobacter fuscus TaxID=43 RepID=A0A250JDQ1_9BACT|nr:hypothetical protein [Cystobacter fuscus]ATB41698.1 hypothetical protein CYFUS_007168 [Cystobacter fuscus]
MANERSRGGLPGTLLISGLMLVGCSASQSIEGVVRPQPGEAFLDSLPGPMPGFGPFDSYSDALLAACPHILSKPNATAGRVQSQDFQLRWRVSREYCAWLYYTPDHKYEMSMLTDQSRLDGLDRKKSCVLPSHVDDQRYPPGSLKYVFALHNHPYAARLSDEDIRAIVAKGRTHGFEAETRDGKVRLAVIAFFSTSSDSEHPTCDGFFQYIPLTSQLLKWTQAEGQWRCQQTGTLRWLNETDFRIEERVAPCQLASGGTP